LRIALVELPCSYHASTTYSCDILSPLASTGEGAPFFLRSPSGFSFRFLSMISHQTLTIPLQAQYHISSGHSSEHGSFHSRLDSSLNSSSISSASRSGHSNLPSGHSQYPSSNSGSGSARVRALAHAGSVEGPMSPAVSAFGHRARDAENSGSSGSGGRQEASSGSGGVGDLERSRSPLSRARSPASPLLSPWAGGLDADWRPT